jgi:hypothetical protein
MLFFTMLRYGPWNLLRREDVDLSAFYFLLRSHKASGKQAEGDHCLEADQGMGDVMGRVMNSRGALKNLVGKQGDFAKKMPN